MTLPLRVHNLSKEYKDFSLTDVSFTLKNNSVMGFIGPNGSGKSTTIKLIMNLVKRDSGQIELFGLDNLKDEKRIKQKIGFVFDENHFHETLTVHEMKNVIRGFYDQWDENLFQKYVHDFELPLKKQIKDLSKGMKMKFSLAIALSHNADLLIMDEPTSGLDPLVRSEFIDILKLYVQDKNKSVFFSTHITSDLEKIADQITLIYKGKIIFTRNKDELMAKHCLVRGNPDALDTMGEQMFIGLKKDQHEFVGLAERNDYLENELGNQVSVERATLEDIAVFYIEGVKSHVAFD
ncbi:ABC transporter ATP-binding protein [Anaerovorax odorimutans]|uniref:ABC transporter ATP-binding protein n=1 Tax=Anaerovorax odorimutans TaxID=109327 RepID=A0ABT1RM51_9FIRM|nr:ABC transporter ATP-binding protein [Anaerovorax odorimutans]MCQ4636263.1 ABC transporter ATP-binding protein [Anaerovorax odorimutans]